MALNKISRPVGRGLAATLFIAAASFTSPSTAYAGHGNNGAGIALGIIGGMVAGAAIASAAVPGYYAPPPAYYYPYTPQAYSAAPAYYYAPPASYYPSAPYYGAPYYGRY